MDTSNFKLRKGVYIFIFNDKGEVLIFQSPHYNADEWSFPGGGVDEGEDPIQTAQREFREEFGTDRIEILGLSKVEFKYLWSKEQCQKRYESTKEQFKGQSRRIIIAKLTEQIKKFHVDAKEVSAYKWVRPKDLKLFLKYPEQEELFQKVMDEFKQNNGTKLF